MPLFHKGPWGANKKDRDVDVHVDAEVHTYTSLEKAIKKGVIPPLGGPYKNDNALKAMRKQRKNNKTFKIGKATGGGKIHVVKFENNAYGKSFFFERSVQAHIRADVRARAHVDAHARALGIDLSV